MARLKYLDSAKHDFVNILSYITRESGPLTNGQQFVGLLRQKRRHRATLPRRMGRPRPELRRDMRSFAFRGYVIFFRYADNTFEVIHVLEGSQDFESYFERHPE